ncbi:MAG: hypothetical protein LPK92_06235, partial [Actinomycetes bacterium]|nr:hypothetical protein [Actinomycetes bacterium]
MAWQRTGLALAAVS